MKILIDQAYSLMKKENLFYSHSAMYDLVYDCHLSIIDCIIYALKVNKSFKDVVEELKIQSFYQYITLNNKYWYPALPKNYKEFETAIHKAIDIYEQQY